MGYFVYICSQILYEMERKRTNRLKVVLTEKVWFARELQQVMGYTRWENFVIAIGRTMESCKTLGINVDDHFREVTKMTQLAVVHCVKFKTLCSHDMLVLPKMGRVCKRTHRNFPKNEK